MSADSNKKFEIDMCNGPLLGKMLKFYFPLMASNILQLIFNAADVAVVGRWAGEDALAAVGSTSALINLLTNLFIGLSIGANVMIARYYGSKQDDELADMAHTAIITAIFSGILLTVIGLTLSGPLLTLMGTTKDALPLAKLYIKIYFCGMPFTMVYNFGAAILRGVGDTRRPLIFLSIAGVVNVILNLIFVILLNMSVAGVSLATIIAQSISAILIIRCLMTTDAAYKISFYKLKFNSRKFLKMMSIGLPAGVQGMLFSISNVIIQSAVNSFDTITVAGNTAAQNIEGFVYMSMNAFYQTAMSFTGQNIGAKKLDRVKKVLIYSLISVSVVGLVLGNGANLASKPLLRIYSTNPDVIAAGALRLKYICTIYFLCGTMDVSVGVIRGMGYSIMPMIVSLAGACAFRMLYIFTIFKHYHTLEILFLSYLFSWILTTAMHLICFAIVYGKQKKILNAKTI